VIVVTKFALFLPHPEWTIWRVNWFVNKVFVLAAFTLLAGWLVQGRLARRAAPGTPAAASPDRRENGLG